MSDMITTKQRLLNPKFWLGVSFFVVVSLLAIWAVQQLNLWLKDEQRLPVQEIVIAGERQFINDQQVEAVIRQAQPGSFFELDVNKALEAVEAMPWVHKASVRKEWPSTLKVFLVEQVPVAHWNSDSLLNQQGSLFNGQLSADAKALPQLFGPGGSEQTALQGYRAMQQLLANSNLQIEELELSERFAWQIKLNNGIRLNIGREEFIDRVQRFVDVYPLLAKNSKTVDYVDLRYDTGLAVGWKQQSES
ncbi:cell division protein FtsQ/DivIB [Neptunicella sp. SCSIO 80796]|uniref:cell division protein FtsQ/DivIB n=1 Tax=Neptunicella plasticusilytica TaxID=3117012 RepID=UPI003A4D2B3E